MKNYLLWDDYGESTVPMNYEELKQLLINEIKDDTYNNYTDRDIVMNNFNIMETLIKDNYCLDFIIKELESCGYYIQDLTDLQKQLTDYQAYKHGVGAPSYPNDCIEQTLKMIEEDMK